jgi:circadian clock protein KaiB
MIVQRRQSGSGVGQHKPKARKAAPDQEPDAEHYRLRLFVTGTTPRSARAIQNLRAICEEYLQGRYDLEIVDIYQHRENVKADQIVVTPTLVKQSPLPVRKLIGDLSDRERVLAALDISAPQPKNEHAA